MDAAYLKAVGIALLVIGLVLWSVPVFAKAAFTHISVVNFSFTKPDGSSAGVGVTGTFTFSAEVADQSLIKISINMAQNASELQIREYYNGSYIGVVAKWSSPKAGQTYWAQFSASGVGNTYQYDVICYWDGTNHGEMCTGIFTVKAPPGSTTRTLTISCTTGGTTDPVPGTYTYTDGSTVTIRAIPDSGYQFSGWSGDVSGTTNPLTLTMDRDYNVVANFSQVPPPPPQYTLTVSVSPSGSGSVSPSGGTYTAGTQVTLTATPASGWRFDRWSGSISSTSNPVTITMDGNKSVTANFVYASAPVVEFYINNRRVDQNTFICLNTTQLQFVLKSDKNLSGATVSVSGTANASISLSPANVLTQWVGNWTAPGEGRYTVTCTASYPGGTVTAACLEVAYGEITAPPGETALVFDIIGQGSVVVTEPEGKTVVPENSIVRVQAFPAPGWRFRSWGGDVVGLSKEPYLSFMASGNSMMIIAEFERKVGAAEMAWSFVRSHLPEVLVALGVVMLISGEALDRRKRL